MRAVRHLLIATYMLQLGRIYSCCNVDTCV